MNTQTLRTKLNDIDQICSMSKHNLQIKFNNINENVLDKYIQRISALYLLIILFEKKTFLSNYANKEIMNDIIDLLLYYDNLILFNQISKNGDR